MKKLLILGGGTAGTMMANKFHHVLDKAKWEITIVDKHETHYYQPGFLFLPFGIYNKSEVEKPKTKFFPSRLRVVFSGVNMIKAVDNEVVLEDGTILQYNFLLIATGAQIKPGETKGLTGHLWQKKIFDFYSLQGAMALRSCLETWKGGKLVMAITELPFKCPVAPLEFVFLAEAYFTKKGMRDNVDITLVTPLSGAFTKPIATKMLGEMLLEKNINVITEYSIEKVDNEKQCLVSYDNKEVPFDLLVIVPVNMGDEVIGRSGLGDEMNFVLTNKHTLQSVAHENIFVVGDAANLPTSKAGSVAHFAGEVVLENMLSAMEGKPLEANFDGHANCYIEAGYGKAVLIDFNYTVEPLPGTFPLPGLGPFSLLKNTRINHYGKMLFKWIYWHVLLKGRDLPVDSKMSMKGKRVINI